MDRSSKCQSSLFFYLVEERIEKMKARGHDMICKVKGAFALEILKLPMVSKALCFFIPINRHSGSKTECLFFLFNVYYSHLKNPTTVKTTV